MPKSDMEKYLNKDTKPKKKKSRKRRKILRTILAIFVIGFVIVAGLGVGLVVGIAGEANNLTKEDFEINKFTTFFYDKDGNQYASVHSGENRMYVSLGDAAPLLPKAFIAIEDERFDSHFGVDIKRTLGATFKWFTGNASYGGSTITQQVIKKVTKEEDRSPIRKIREMIRAIQLEQWLSKDQIIELYMNIIYLGEGAYGVQTAAYTYFDKDASELTIAECALIAGLAQSPEGYNPYNYPEKAKNKQLLVLSKMLELGYISESEYEEAKAQELVYKKGSIGGSSNSYYIDAVIEEVIVDLQAEKGISRAMAQKMVFNNGLQIYTCVNPQVQDALETVYEDPSYFKNAKGEYDPLLQSAMVIIDYKKGEVAGLIGGAGKKTTERGLNRATQSTRAPGSNMKPIGVYGPGLQKGVLNAATVFDDIPTDFKVGSNIWTPVNYDRRYRGLTSIRKAIEVSMNVMAVKAFNEVGVDYSVEFLKKLGITTIVEADKYPASLALGGMTNGIKPIEMAGAYGTFANGGIYVEPKLYTKVLDRSGNPILEKKSDVRDVMSKQNAFILTDMLRDVVFGSEGTARSVQFNGMDIAGKTGTTSSSNDRWFTAYTPYYVGSVWVGYDQQKTISTSVNPSAKLWRAVMVKAHEGLAAKKFEKPTGIVQVQICKDSGLLPTDLCKKDQRGDRTRTEYFVSGQAPKEYCSTHVVFNACADTMKIPTPYCVGTVGWVFLDRHYTSVPRIKPEDYAYEVPSEVCTMHSYQAPTEEPDEKEDTEKKDNNETVGDNSDLTPNENDTYNFRSWGL